ncbi:LytTR family DNA-binding domain-containing protein [Rhodocaloribacter litoris]|uniref:LytR/AlgR family response regulator transcription factor n=1 Tax=Rhodocaloribacter litoris TaxID=2558931 RepID=UPI00142205CF|nr:LytTR family DNA-binding domain-containing protein [Rhodocaloribacter litoris]QXD15457.1 LytTR family DNA-binding domain-containing protein [Rhodocaloribacter litoris]
MLRVLIVDDEAPARRRLARLLKPMETAGRVQVAGEAADGPAALDLIARRPVDLIFLDIQMPEMDGFGVVERLDPERRPVVVFTTAYDDYALRAFEANAVDYLLKPIARKRLEEAVGRAERLAGNPGARADRDDRLERLLDWMEAHAEAERPRPAPPPPAHTDRDGTYLQQLSIPYRDRILIVPVERIVAVEISEGITRVFVLDEPQGPGKPRLRQHVVSYTLDQLEAHLDPEAFMRVHRSAIVQYAHIRELIPWFSGRYKLLLTGGHEVIASRERSRLLKERLLL